ncbi:hypothetical protein ACWCQZ_47155 [Streptomyces sp. NPDC002285]
MLRRARRQEVVQDGFADGFGPWGGGGRDDAARVDDLVPGGLEGHGEAGAIGVSPRYGLHGIDHGAAQRLMLGAILVVSGPTVVGPLLAFVRPTDRLQRILAWEGSLVDPVGALLGALVFAAVLNHSDDRHFGSAAVQFAISVGVGLAGAAVGTALLWLLLVRLRPGEVLATSGQLVL